jgi:guanine deaminase
MIKEMERAYGCQMLLHGSAPELSVKLSGTKLLWLATKGGAEALDLADEVGCFTPGLSADIVCIDLNRETYLPQRMRNCSYLAEELFVLCIAGNAHLISEVFIDGDSAYRAS